MIRVKTLTVQLIDAQPDRIRICRIDGESLVTVVVPREDLAEAKSLPNIPQRGVYYLLDEDHGNVSRVYAGQTTQGIARLDAHKAKKEFWNKAVMFLDDDQNISRDALDVLEAKAIDYVRTHGSYETDNSATPKPYVDPYKEEAVERLHERILFRMAALGYDLDRIDRGPAGAGGLPHEEERHTRGGALRQGRRALHRARRFESEPLEARAEERGRRGRAQGDLRRFGRHRRARRGPRVPDAQRRGGVRARRQPERLDRMGKRRRGNAQPSL